jgi:ADP-ribose pyrophosphatase YjhB (NUDIX family)
VIIENDRHEVLIGRTSADADAPQWEFPTETVSGDQAPEAAARRAAREKVSLAIEIDTGQPPFEHEFDDRIVTYRYFLAGVIKGTAKPIGYEEVRWIQKGQLREYLYDAPTQTVVNWLLEEE